MANSNDGLSWGEGTPTSADARKDGADEILSIRKGVRLRYSKEFTTPVVISDNPTLATGGGQARQGIARAFLDTDEPTNRPDGLVALGAVDSGRLWVDSTTGHAMKVYDGSNFQNVSGVEQASGSETEAALIAARPGARTLSVGFIPDLLIVHFGVPGEARYILHFNLASEDPMTILIFTSVNSLTWKAEMNGTDVDLTFVSSTAGTVGGGANIVWRAFKY